MREVLENYIHIPVPTHFARNVVCRRFRVQDRLWEKQGDLLAYRLESPLLYFYYYDAADAVCTVGW